MFVAAVGGACLKLAGTAHDSDSLPLSSAARLLASNVRTPLTEESSMLASLARCRGPFDAPDCINLVGSPVLVPDDDDDLNFQLNFPALSLRLKMGFRAETLAQEMAMVTSMMDQRLTGIPSRNGSCAMV